MIKTLIIVIATAAAMMFGYHSDVDFEVHKVRIQKAPKSFELNVKDAPKFFEKRNNA